MVKLASQTSEEIRSSRELAPLVEQADRWVADITSTWPSPVAREWYPIVNVPQGSMIGLRVSNEHGYANGLFTVEELSNQFSFHYKLNPVLTRLTQASVDSIARWLRESYLEPTGNQ